MKKMIVSTAAVAVLSGLLAPAWGQNSKSRQETVPHKVGLIDMARVFKEYEKFKALRQDLQGEIQQSDQAARSMAQKIQSLKEQIKEFNPSSPEAIKIEKDLAQQTTEFETFRKVAQRDFLRKESQIYRTIYLEVSDVVQKYAEHFDYTLIMRFTGDKLDSADPQKLIQGLNRQVVYYRTEFDITDPVIDYLNQKYAPQTTKKPSTTPTAQKPSSKTRTK